MQVLSFAAALVGLQLALTPIAVAQLVNHGLDPSWWHTPLSECEGDCDSDSDCSYGLKCWFRSSSDSCPVPGCTSGGSGDVESYDYCYDPAQVSIWTRTSCPTGSSSGTSSSGSSSSGTSSSGTSAAEGNGMSSSTLGVTVSIPSTPVQNDEKGVRTAVDAPFANYAQGNAFIHIGRYADMGCTIPYGHRTKQVVGEGMCYFASNVFTAKYERNGTHLYKNIWLLSNSRSRASECSGEPDRRIKIAPFSGECEEFIGSHESGTATPVYHRIDAQGLSYLYSDTHPIVQVQHIASTACNTDTQSRSSWWNCEEMCVSSIVAYPRDLETEAQCVDWTGEGFGSATTVHQRQTLRLETEFSDNFYELEWVHEACSSDSLYADKVALMRRKCDSHGVAGDWHVVESQSTSSTDVIGTILGLLMCLGCCGAIGWCIKKKNEQ